jgi:hypothetical protein
VNYADDLVLLAKEEKVLHDMIDKLIEIGRYYGMETNVKKSKSSEKFKTTIVVREQPWQNRRSRKTSTIG